MSDASQPFSFFLPLGCSVGCRKPPVPRQWLSHSHHWHPKYNYPQPHLHPPQALGRWPHPTSQWKLKGSGVNFLTSHSGMKLSRATSSLTSFLPGSEKLAFEDQSSTRAFHLDPSCLRRDQHLHLVPLVIFFSFYLQTSPRTHYIVYLQAQPFPY